MASLARTAGKPSALPKASCKTKATAAAAAGGTMNARERLLPVACRQPNQRPEAHQQHEHRARAGTIHLL